MRSSQIRTVEATLLRQVRDFYVEYMEVLDDERMTEWSSFFTDDCVYQIIPRENYDSNSELCTMQAEGKGMLLDRVTGMLTTQEFGPQRCRRFYSGLKVSVDDGKITARQNVLAVQSLLDQPSSILLCGASYDELALEDGEIFFRRRIVVSDTEIISNALILPL